MSLDINKPDFEKALLEMKDVIEDLDLVIDDVIMDTLKAVINEYDAHYESDIQEMIDSNEEMKEKLEELEK